MMCQSNTTQFYFIMFIIVLGQYVLILTELSSGPSNKIDPYLKCSKMRCGIPNADILDKTMYKMHVSCSYSTIFFFFQWRYSPGWASASYNQDT